MRKFDLSLRSSRSSYFATFRHQLTILSKTDALDEEKWLNMLGTFVKDWFRYESHFVHGRDSLVDILKERGLLSESDEIPLTLSNLKLLRRITRTENILHRNFTRRQVAIQNRVASNIGISQSTFSVKVLNLFSRSRRKTNKRKSKHSAMLRNKETRHRMFIGLLNTT